MHIDLQLPAILNEPEKYSRIDQDFLKRARQVNEPLFCLAVQLQEAGARARILALPRTVFFTLFSHFFTKVVKLIVSKRSLIVRCSFKIYVDAPLSEKEWLFWGC